MRASIDHPTAYVDANLFRYIAQGELVLSASAEVSWVYSYVHLDEASRNENDILLSGINNTNAIELYETVNSDFQSTGEISFRSDKNVFQRYEEYVSLRSRLGDPIDAVLDHFLGIFGAQRYSEIEEIPANTKRKIDTISLRAFEQEHPTENTNVKPLSETRKNFGLAHGASEIARGSDNPIEAIWETIKDRVSDTSLEYFFGFAPDPKITSVPFNQHGSVGGSHIMLNILGYYPDKGLSRRDRIRNVFSDSRHVGFSSYCDYLISADKRLCAKADAIFRYLRLPVYVHFVQYCSGGMSFELDVDAVSF